LFKGPKCIFQGLLVDHTILFHITYCVKENLENENLKRNLEDENHKRNLEDENR